ncbi:MAG: hydroxyneurosporene dehydrogenase [Rhodococcus sp. (in: high G+C Gram-positive bacteria)]|uniref:hydroxyneurosporene dehydrogenase n=1 Tax=Rhodococcus sp. TaxID=1831 RepID=UPI003BB78E1B
MKLREDEVEEWEDGQRISTDSGNLEWWYFDAHLEDGTAIVVQFYARSPFTPVGPFRPSVTIHIDLPDGRSIAKQYTGSASEFSASQTTCDVRVGRNRFTGDLHRYRIDAQIDDVEVGIDLVGTVPSYRHMTSHSYFGDPGDAKLFAWLPAVPQGDVTAKLTIDGTTRTLRGTGYHDHNWGDAPMWSVLHDWYWARAKIGPWTAIVASNIAEKKYDYDQQINFMLAKDGVILVKDHAKTTFTPADITQDEKTGKPVANRIAFDYEDGEERFHVQFDRVQTILQEKLVDQLPALARPIARFSGFNGAYHRFTGDVSIEHTRGGSAIDQAQDTALWELFYFGKPRPTVPGSTTWS